MQVRSSAPRPFQATVKAPRRALYFHSRMVQLRAAAEEVSAAQTFHGGAAAGWAVPTLLPPCTAGASALGGEGQASALGD